MSEMTFKTLVYSLLHVNYLVGVGYALTRFLATPRLVYEPRRLWAYETWIILSFWGIFTAIYFIEQEKMPRVKKARQIILTNLILLVFPWGLFLLLAPASLMSAFGLGSTYWRVLGFCSLVGALIYYYPYRFWQKKLTRPILIFGFFDNLLAACIIFSLFVLKRVPFIALGSVPLLLYFSIFFLRIYRYHRRSVR